LLAGLAQSRFQTAQGPPGDWRDVHFVLCRPLGRRLHGEVDVVEVSPIKVHCGEKVAAQPHKFCQGPINAWEVGKDCFRDDSPPAQPGFLVILASLPKPIPTRPEATSHVCCSFGQCPQGRKQSPPGSLQGSVCTTAVRLLNSIPSRYVSVVPRPVCFHLRGQLLTSLPIRSLQDHPLHQVQLPRA
jgi:hypothetical protein